MLIVLALIITVTFIILDLESRFVIPVIVSLVLIGLLSAGISHYFIKDENIVITQETQKIYSLKSQRDVTGDFVLGAGSINQVPKYSFYIDYGNGTKILKDVDAKTTAIKETDNEEPQFVIHRKHYNVPTWIDLFVSIPDDSNLDQTLIIPEKSIRTNYELN